MSGLEQLSSSCPRGEKLVNFSEKQMKDWNKKYDALDSSDRDVFAFLISYLERYLLKANLSSHILRIWRLGKFQQVFASKKRLAFHGCACIRHHVGEGND